MSLEQQHAILDKTYKDLTKFCGKPPRGNVRNLTFHIWLQTILEVQDIPSFVHFRSIFDCPRLSLHSVLLTAKP